MPAFGYVQQHSPKGSVILQLLAKAADVLACLSVWCDSFLQEAECKREMLDVKFMSDTKTADSKRAFEMQKAAFSQEINIKVRASCFPLAGLLTWRSIAVGSFWLPFSGVCG